VTLEQMKMLVTLAEVGTLKASSAKLFKTQAAISQGIKQLESQLGVLLFDRNGYRLTLTDQGQQIYQQGLKLLQQANNIEILSKHFSQGHEASITLAFEASFDLVKVLPVLEMVQNTFPQTQINLRHEYISGAYSAILQDRADLAITPVNKRMLDPSNHDSIVLCHGSLVNVAAAKMLARHPNLKSNRELENEYQIVVQDTGQETQGIHFDVQEGQRRWYVNDFATKKTLILSGMGWGRLPDFLVQDELKSGALSIIELEESEAISEVEYRAIKQRDKPLGPVATALWQGLEKLQAE